jgi:hypothetical protein
VRNTSSMATDGRIGGHDPPRFSGGFPGSLQTSIAAHLLLIPCPELLKLAKVGAVKAGLDHRSNGDTAVGRCGLYTVCSVVCPIYSHNLRQYWMRESQRGGGYSR